MITGKGIGSIMMGQLIKYLGGRWSFRVIAAMALIHLLLYVLFNKFCVKTSSPRPPIDLEGAKSGKRIDFIFFFYRIVFFQTDGGE